MFDVVIAPDIGAVVALVAVSFVSFVGGLIFRKWPEKVQAYTEDMDGFAWLITPEANREMIAQCGGVLVVVSFAALFAAAWML